MYTNHYPSTSCKVHSPKGNRKSRGTRRKIWKTWYWVGIKLKSFPYGYKWNKVLESWWKELWSHLAGRKPFRQYLKISCQYRSRNGVFHVSIDRKTVYKGTCKSANLQWPSDHLQNRISPQKSNKWLSDYLQPRNSLRKVTSSSELGTFLRKPFQPSLVFIDLSVRSSLWILIGLSVLLEDLNIKLDLHKLSSSLYPGDTRIWWTQIPKIKHFL